MLTQPLPLILVFLLLFYPFVYSGVTYTAPTTAVYDDSSTQSVGYSYSPTQRIATFSGLNQLSNSAVVTLQIWLLHTWNRDLEMRLYSPSGSYIILSYRNGEEYDNVFNGTLFTDSASTKVSSYSFQNNVVAPSVRPEEAFSNFRGKDPNGQWKIWINDLFSGDDGYLNRVILTITGINSFSEIIKKKENKIECG